MITEIWTYLKNPTYTPYSDEEKVDKWRIFGRILILTIAFSIGFGLISELFVSSFNIDLGEHGIEALIEKYSIYVLFLLATILAPLLEELLFRAPLALFKSFKYFNLIFYSIVILFGLIHLTNFENYAEYWWFAPIMVAPQISAGVFLGFIRVKLGLGYSILLHAMHNGLIFLPFVIATVMEESVKL